MTVRKVGSNYTGKATCLMPLSLLLSGSSLFAEQHSVHFRISACEEAVVAAASLLVLTV